jgi:hypothetical protein
MNQLEGGECFPEISNLEVTGSSTVGVTNKIKDLAEIC